MPVGGQTAEQAVEQASSEPFVDAGAISMVTAVAAVRRHAVARGDGDRERPGRRWASPTAHPQQTGCPAGSESVVVTGGAGGGVPATVNAKL
ncbi:hypothetical protein [Rhodococcus koreensis]